MSGQYIIGNTREGKLEVVSISEDGKLSISVVGQYEVYFAFGSQSNVQDVRNNNIQSAKPVSKQKPSDDVNDADWWKNGGKPKFNLK